jgi:hypothetical protein
MGEGKIIVFLSESFGNRAYCGPKMDLRDYKNVLLEEEYA